MSTLTDALPNFDVPNIDLPNIEPPRLDVPEAIAGALDAAGIRRRSPWRRRPLALAGIVAAALAGWAILNNEAIRARLNESIGSIRQWISTMRSPVSDLEPVAFPAAETKPIEPGPMAEYETPEVADYPPGLGSVASSRS
jgi:hypothetical protein